MKKTVIILIVVCLAAVAALGFLLGKGTPSPVAELETASPAPEAVDGGTQAAESPAASGNEQIDFDAIYALHAPDEIVLRTQDGELRWGDYFYYLYSQARQIEDYFSTMAMYGMSMSWSDVAEGDDTTYADIAVEGAESIGKQILSIEGFCADAGVVLGEAEQEQLSAQREQAKLQLCGEGATEEAFAEALKTMYLTPEIYDRMNRINVLYQQGFIQLYGEDGEKLSDEAAVQYLQDNGYMSAHHILFLTGELSEEEAEAKRQQLQDLAEELRAIEDPAERLQRFEELKAELCEDGGKISYPNGYTFTPNTMVPEFEEAALSLGDYEIADPVKTDYGYHLIMRLPLLPDSLVFSSNDAPRTARAMAANAEYGARIQARLDDAVSEFAPGFEPIDLLDYLAAPADK